MTTEPTPQGLSVQDDEDHATTFQVILDLSEAVHLVAKDDDVAYWQEALALVKRAEQWIAATVNKALEGGPNHDHPR